MKPEEEDFMIILTDKFRFHRQAQFITEGPVRTQTMEFPSNL